jgi:uncharacterized membrane protein
MEERMALRIITGLLFVLAGANHLRVPGFYLRMMPPGLPWPGALVWVSGLAEMAGGVGLLVPAMRVPAAWGLIALLVAVYPANIYMALRPERFVDVVPVWALWARLPLQFAFVAWVWWVGIAR